MVPVVDPVVGDFGVLLVISVLVAGAFLEEVVAGAVLRTANSN